MEFPFPASARTRRALPLLSIGVAASGWIWMDPLGWLAPTHRLEEPAAWHASQVGQRAAWNEKLSVLRGRPAISSGSAYRERAHRWLLDRFEEEAQLFTRWEPPASPAIAVRIHSQPMTSPAIVADLDASAGAERARCEAGLVESRVLALLKGVTAAEFLRFHVHSNFEQVFGPLGGVEASSSHGPLFGTPLPFDLQWNEAEELPSNHCVRRELTSRDWLRLPTRFATTAVLDLEGPIGVYRWELLTDEVPADGAEVRFTAGVLFARDVPAGALIWHHSFYAGQEIPSALHAFAARRIEASHRQYLDVYGQEVAPWCRKNSSHLQVSARQGR